MDKLFISSFSATMTSRESLRWIILVVFVIVLSGTAFYFSMKNRPQVAIQVGKIVPVQVDQNINK